MFLFYVSSASRNFGDVKAAAVERHHRELKMRACGFEGLAGLGRKISRLARKSRIALLPRFAGRSFLVGPATKSPAGAGLKIRGLTVAACQLGAALLLTD
jgi:hypothetical protein